MVTYGEPGSMRKTTSTCDPPSPARAFMVLLTCTTSEPHAGALVFAQLKDDVMLWAGRRFCGMAA